MPESNGNGGKKSERFTLRVSRAEREAWEKAAGAEGRSVGQFVRMAANRAAEGARKLRDYGKGWVS